ncbi:MAG: VWA domain-containing protein [Thermoanaerobaculia bacterium]
MNTLLRQHLAFTIFLVAVTALVLILPLLAGAQEPPPGQFEGEVDVTEVFLDVVVTDRQGQPVPGLQAGDFVVTEDGEPVEVTSVEYYTTRYGAPEAELKPGEVPASRHFIFFFDDQRFNSTPENRLLPQQVQAGRQAAEWARENLQPSDWAAVLSYDSRLKIHLDFAQDRDAIVEAIEAASRGGEPRAETSRRGGADAGVASLLARLPTGKELSRITPRPYSALTRVAEAVGPIAGRKNLLLFSIGFGQIDSFTGTARGDERYYPDMIQALNDNNVAVYAIDVSTLETRFHSQETFLSQLASDTGARYFAPTVSFATPLEQVSEETTGYYLLSYRAQHPRGETGYQRVKVDTHDNGLRVHARKGYQFGT